MIPHSNEDDLNPIRKPWTGGFHNMKRQLAVNFRKAGVSTAKTAVILDVSENTLYDYYKILKNTHKEYLPRHQPGPKKRELTSYYEPTRQLLKDEPQSTPSDVLNALQSQSPRHHGEYPFTRLCEEMNLKYRRACFSQVKTDES